MTEGLGTKRNARQGLSIQLEYCERYGITLDEMLGRSKRAPIVKARQEAMAQVRMRLGYSYPRIGRLFKRDHTTALWACRKHGIEADPTASLIAKQSAMARSAMTLLVRMAA